MNNKILNVYEDETPVQKDVEQPITELEERLNIGFEIGEILDKKGYELASVDGEVILRKVS